MRWLIARLVLALSLSACGAAIPNTPSAAPQAAALLQTATPVPATSTSAPSATTSATQTPVPTASATQTLTPSPTVTALPTATATPTVAPTATPSITPNANPLPTFTPTVTTMAVPTVAILVPTIIQPAPTASPTPTPTQTKLPPATLPPATSPPTPKRRMVALVFGQSNAGNYGDVRVTSRAGVFNLRYGNLTVATDPLRGAQGEGGSVWTRLGDQLIAANIYDEVVFVPVAFGGTEIAQWVPEMPLFKQIESAVKDVNDRGWRFTHLLWHHGESDNALKIGYADYQLRFRNMLRGIRELGVDAPVFVSVASRCGQYGPNSEIQGAQSNLVDHGQRIWAGPNTDNLGNEFRYDTCHLNAAGQNATALLWLGILRAYEGR